MKLAPARLLVAGGFALSICVALPFEGIAATRPVSRVSLPANVPHFGQGPLTKAEILRLSAGVNQHVIVVLKGQFKASTGHLHDMALTRDAAISTTQRPVLSELRAVHALNLKPFHIIDAIKATVSRSEETRLKANPAVRAIVPDAEIQPPEIRLIGATVDKAAISRRAEQAVHLSTPTPTCAGKTPRLQPEALMDTHTAYPNPQAPQAQNVATGKHVRVAIVSGPIDRYNPDFIRADGKPVITDYENFGSDPPDTAGGGGGWDLESFLDMSSVAAQGNLTLNANQLVGADAGICNPIRIVGVAPDASVTWLDVVGQNGSATSNFVQAIQYANDTHANVISESFGGDVNNDTGVDPIAMADAQAVHEGATVVASSGDEGPNALGSPADIQPVISAGGTTSFNYRNIIGLTKAEKLSGVLNDNVVAFSSSGIAQSGTKSVDVVAPGAFGFVDCTPDPSLYPSCTSVSGQPLDFNVVGGTSESAPLTAGEAALVIQAYKDTHGQAIPKPSLVKHIIMSTATDLGDPTAEQGAGLINSYRAVLAAQSWAGSDVRNGSALVASTADLTAKGLPGTGESLTFSVTNAGKDSEVVAPRGRVVTSSAVTHQTKVSVAPTALETTCALNGAYGYTHYCPPTASVKFRVPSGSARISVDIGWSVVQQPYSELELRLITPNNRYAGNTEPGDYGPPITSSGYGHVDIARPMAGTWQAQIVDLGFCANGGSCSKPATPLYHGTAIVNVTTTKVAGYGSVSPARQTLAPGSTGSFTLKTKLPKNAGDSNANVIVTGKDSSGRIATAGAIPVILRTIIPVSRSGGSFVGTFQGGSGELQMLWDTSYEFKVPAGTKTLGLGITVAENNDDLQGVLVDPEGYDVNIESTITKLNTNVQSPTLGFPKAFGKTMQFFQANPPAGNWRFILEVDGTVSGRMTTIPFKGNISLNAANASVRGLPDSASTVIPSGTAKSVTLRVKNTGDSPEQVFVDPRRTAKVGFVSSVGLTLPTNRYGNNASPDFLVPPDSSNLLFGAESVATNSTPTLPIIFDAANVDGAAPWGLLEVGGNDPDVLATPGFDAAISDYSASATMVSKYEMPEGIFSAAPATIGPYPEGEPESKADVGVLLTTHGFDNEVSSDTGDLWTDLMFGSGIYRPLKLQPGQSGTITIRIKPNQPTGTIVKGDLDVDTMPNALADGYIFPYTWSGNQLAALPYEYRVG